MTPPRLHPTPRRLSWLADADAGRLPLYLTTHQAELKAEGWIELATPAGPWQLTALGRAIREVRIHTREDGRHMVAETGDPDEPRVLGEAWREAGRKWLIEVDDVYAAWHTVHQAREELRHMAAALLAAEPNTVQEGQTP